jgi:hypothetical protein
MRSRSAAIPQYLKSGRLAMFFLIFNVPYAPVVFSVAGYCGLLVRCGAWCIFFGWHLVRIVYLDRYVMLPWKHAMVHLLYFWEFLIDFFGRLRRWINWVLTISHLNMEFFVFCGALETFTVFSRSHYLSLSRDRWIRSTLSYPISWRSILIASSSFGLGPSEVTIGLISALP